MKKLSDENGRRYWDNIILPDGTVLTSEDINIGLYNIWKQYKGDAKYFIETGTHYGGGLYTATIVGFEKYFSVDLHAEMINHCRDRFKDRLNDDIFLSCSSSSTWLGKLMPFVKEKSLFWLDAHAFGGGAPVFEELEIIGRNDIKDHIICVDDIPIYYGDGQRVKDACLKINPNYKFAWTPPEHMPGKPNYVLIAYIEEK
jgi:hypothetical protein